MSTVRLIPASSISAWTLPVNRMKTVASAGDLARCAAAAQGTSASAIASTNVFMEDGILLRRQRCASGSDAHHLVAASLKLVRDHLQGNDHPRPLEGLADRPHKRRALSIERQQRKNPDLSRHATELVHRGSMEILAETSA